MVCQQKLVPMDVENIDANKFKKTVLVHEVVENDGHLCFELSICKYDHLNNTRRYILRVPLIFINVRHLIYLYIYKFYNFILGKYI